MGDNPQADQAGPPIGHAAHAARRSRVTQVVATVFGLWATADAVASLLFTQGASAPLVAVTMVITGLVLAALLGHRRGAVSQPALAWTALIGLGVTVSVSVWALGPGNPYLLFGATLPLVGALMLGPTGALASFGVLLVSYALGFLGPDPGWFAGPLQPRILLTAWALATMGACSAAITYFYERANRDALDALAAAVELATDAQRHAQESQEQLIHSSRLAALGQLAGGVAHELNNPLASITLRTEFLAEDIANRQDASALLVHAEQIHQAALHSGEILGQLLRFSRRSPPAERRTVDLARQVDGVVGLVGSQLRVNGTTLRCGVPPGLTVNAHGAELQQVLTNLLLNASQATGKGTITIEGSRRDDTVLLTVRDDGPGMSEEVRARIFEPFFTTRPSGSGTGLGLSISQGIALAHNGALDCVTAPGEGASFVLTLPFDPRAVVPVEPARRRRAGRLTGLRVLVVDDEETVLTDLIEAIRRAGCSTRRAPGASEALEILRREPIDVVLTDLEMPGDSGLTLMRAARRVSPGIPAVLLVGRITEEQAAEAELLGIAAILQKPCTGPMLVDALASARR